MRRNFLCTKPIACYCYIGCVNAILALWIYVDLSNPKRWHTLPNGLWRTREQSQERTREGEKTPSEQKKQKAIDIFPFSVPNWQIFVLDARFFILCAFSI